MSAGSENLMEQYRALFESVDEITRARAGSLAARGLNEFQISKILMLDVERVMACAHSPEYKRKYAEVAEAEIQMQIDLEEGWDVIEAKSVTQIIEALDYMKDPKFALLSARTANQAKRRSRPEQNNPVIDASKTTNIIQIQLNRNFVKKTQKTETTGVLDVTPRVVENIPLKQHDLPSPASVENLLAPVRQVVGKDRMLSEIEQAFEDSGVFANINDE